MIQQITLIMSTLIRKRAQVHENSRIFQCKYCPRTFSKCGVFQNHFRTHRDQIYLDKNKPAREDNISELKTVIRNILQRTILSPILFNDTTNLCKKQSLNINDEHEK